MTHLARELGDGVGTREVVQATYQGNVQNVSYTSSAAASSAFGTNTSVIRLLATTDCYYLVGTNPTATSSNGSRLPAGVVERIAVNPGDKISAIRVSSDGSLNITEAGQNNQ